MATYNARALVVDDDAVAREIILHALGQQGLAIACDVAADGRQARALLASRCYDVVVTDLQLPNGNGHALCVDLLQRPDPPLIVVVTGITHPGLARDLMARGVDDVLFKPIDGKLLAIKVEVLIARRLAARQGDVPYGHPPPARSAGAPVASVPSAIRRIDVSELETKVLGLAQLLPISPAALEVVQMTSSDISAQRIATTILRDPTLAAELLKLANSQFYNPTGQKIVDLGAAVVRIGTKRIGELAMATAALSGLTVSRLPWIDTGLTWRCSLAAGLAVDRLAEQVGMNADHVGLFLSALMHDLGRVLLGTAYPKEYQAMIAACEQSGTSLLEQEQCVFPLHHTDVMARVLASWKVPSLVYQPLKHFADTYRHLENVSDPLRTKAELVKIAVLVGQLAAGAWEPWRAVEIPPVPVLARLDLRSLEELLDQTTIELHGLVKAQQSSLKGQPPNSLGAVARSSPTHRLSYCRLSSTRFDFLAAIIQSMGIQIVAVNPESVATLEGAVINCLGIPASRLIEHVPNFADGRRRLIITDAHRTEEYRMLGTALALPSSYATLRNGCWKFVGPAPKQHTDDRPAHIQSVAGQATC